MAEEQAEAAEPKYTAKKLEDVATKPGCWNHIRIGVFDGDRQIGEYVRNYSAFYDTFHPFKAGDRWFALYSPHYTATRLMSLPDCKDIGGEEANSYGFCPVEFLVPKLCGQDFDPNDPEPKVANHDSATWALRVPLEGGLVRYYWPNDPQHPNPDPERAAAYEEAVKTSHALWRAWQDRHPYRTIHAPWGFVAGCVWGDDSGGWKVEFLDLSKAAEGILVRDSRFGYVQLPGKVGLKDGIRVDVDKYLQDALDDVVVEIAQPVRYAVSGRKLED